MSNEFKDVHYRIGTEVTSPLDVFGKATFCFFFYYIIFSKKKKKNYFKIGNSKLKLKLNRVHSWHKSMHWIRDFYWDRIRDYRIFWIENFSKKS